MIGDFCRNLNFILFYPGRIDPCLRDKSTIGVASWEYLYTTIPAKQLN